VEEYCRENNIPFKILLIVNNAPSHPARLDHFRANVKVVFLPPNTTSIPHPMDQGVTVSLKAYYLRRTSAQVVEETNNGLILRQFWELYNIYQATKHIAKAWEDVSKFV
jgi:hypothetical protein